MLTTDLYKQLTVNTGPMLITDLSLKVTEFTTFRR